MFVTEDKHMLRQCGALRMSKHSNQPDKNLFSWYCRQLFMACFTAIGAV